MSNDSITRWECPLHGDEIVHYPMPSSAPQCVGADGDEFMAFVCPEVPVERVYVAVDALLTDGAVYRITKGYEAHPVRVPASWNAAMRDALQTVIAAVVEGTGP